MNLRTSDLAICAETSAFSIRDYSDQGLLGPVPRAEGSNYRFFDPRLIPQVYLIKALREMGLSAQQLADYGRERSPERAGEVLGRCSEQLRRDIARQQASLDMLRSYLSLIGEGRTASPGEIELRQLPARPLRRSSLETLGGRLSPAQRLRSAFGDIRQNGNAGCPLGFAWRDFFDFMEQPDQPTLLVSYDPQGPDARPAGDYLVGTQHCYYGEMGPLPRRMFEYALHGGMEFTGPAYTVYLLDAASVTGAEEYLMQVTVGITRNAI
ncbi:MAG: MerR family transcriptional regulator [Oscillospiraceae bacterium]|nr:MerR family transcriptional regulator [Oscillospiraceae bacterium]